MKTAKMLWLASTFVLSSHPVWGIKFLNSKDFKSKLYRTAFLCTGSEKTVAEVDYPSGMVSDDTIHSLLNAAQIQKEDPKLVQQNKMNNAIARFMKFKKIADIKDNYNLLSYSETTPFRKIMEEFQFKETEEKKKEKAGDNKKIHMYKDAKAYKRIENILQFVQKERLETLVQDIPVKDIRVYRSYYFWRDANPVVPLRCNTALLKGSFGNSVETDVMVDGKWVENKGKGKDTSSIQYEPLELDSNIKFTVDLRNHEMVKATVLSIFSQKVVVIHQFHIFGYKTSVSEVVGLLETWRKDKGYSEFEEPALEENFPQNSIVKDPFSYPQDFSSSNDDNDDIP